MLKRWQAWLKMRGAFGGHFSSQFCETDVEFDLGHDDDSVQQALRTTRAHRVAGAILRRPRQKVARPR